MSLLEPEACEAIDPEALLGRSVYYARREGAGGETLGEGRSQRLSCTLAGA